MKGAKILALFEEIARDAMADLIAQKDRRIQELLEANNAYLQRARDAEARARKAEADLLLSPGFISLNSGTIGQSR